MPGDGFSNFRRLMASHDDRAFNVRELFDALDQPADQGLTIHIQQCFMRTHPPGKTGSQDDRAKSVGKG